MSAGRLAVSTRKPTHVNANRNLRALTSEKTQLTILVLLKLEVLLFVFVDVLSEAGILMKVFL